MAQPNQSNPPLSGQATVTDNGQGVVLYEAPETSSDGISFSGQGDVNLSGMTAAQLATLGLTAPQYVGPAIFQDRTSTAPIQLSGQGNVNITGSVYAASSAVTISGNGSLNLKGSPAKKSGAHLLVADLTVSGNGNVSVDTSDNNLELLQRLKGAGSLFALLQTDSPPLFSGSPHLLFPS
jgi:hypothetical protein